MELRKAKAYALENPETRTSHRYLRRQVRIKLLSVYVTTYWKNKFNDHNCGACTEFSIYTESSLAAREAHDNFDISITSPIEAGLYRIIPCWLHSLFHK